MTGQYFDLIVLSVNGCCQLPIIIIALGGSTEIGLNQLLGDLVVCVDINVLYVECYMRVRQLNVKCPFTKISVRYAVILPGLQKHITESASGDLMEDQPLLKLVCRTIDY